MSGLNQLFAKQPTSAMGSAGSNPAPSAIFCIMETTVRDVLLFLEDTGWSDLIDKRWERQLIKEIQSQFPGIEKDVLEEVLNLVLV